MTGELEDADIEALTEICKSAHGLAEAQGYSPLTKDHLPPNGTEAGHVNIQSIVHHRGVNALAEDQTVTFGTGLTVVYGDNAAGKSGYTRILKSACRARGPEGILGNVLSGTAPPTASVSIKYTVGGDGIQHEWTGEGDDESIARVSVFDSHSATVYLTEKTDVAFRPFGLDLFDKLAKACKTVRDKLECEKRALGAGGLQTLDLPEGTAAAKLVVSLSSLTDPEEVKALAMLSEEEKERLKLLGKQLVDLQAKDPAKTARELTLRAGRLRSLVNHLRAADGVLSAEAVKAIFDSQRELQTKREEAGKLRDATFPAGLLSGTGSDSWVVLWEAARQFSETEAYPDRKFPVTEEERCVLCQQRLEANAAVRLKQFETFVISATEKELREARETYTGLYKGLDELRVTNETVEEAVKEIRIEVESLADEVSASLTEAEARCGGVVKGLQNEQGMPGGLAEYTPVAAKIESLAEQLDQRVQGLQKEAGEGEKEKITTELQELEARERLGKFESHVLREIERKKKIAAYGLCLDDTRTQRVTIKSTAITKVVVTKKLKESFQDELKNLEFKHVEVELKEIGGDLGNMYHKLLLTRAPGVELPRVVSEGEARCLSIAAFFAELSTADDPSAILFDDPVSSLDYKWRDSVAYRLVEEAKTRQVMVFTHDIVFLLRLKQYAKEQDVEMLDQHVRQSMIGAGVCEQELPWVAMPVKKRIGFLKNAWQDAKKLFDAGDDKAYEKEATHMYGLLQEAWERGLEEVLLCGIVERYRVGVQTQQIEKIADISLEDCRALEVGMTKCSNWRPGHDRAPAAQQDVPEPDELIGDIKALETWVSGINKRRPR